MPRVQYFGGDPRSGINQELTPPSIPDGQRKIEQALAGERGSTFSQNRIFEWYENELVFLQGPTEDFEIEAMLANDGKARAVEQVLTLPIRGARWDIKAGKGDTGEQQFAHDLLLKPADEGGMRTPFKTLIAQATAACLYRSSCFEKVFKLNDQGMVVYDAVAYRPPTSCYLARSASTARLEGFLQWTWVDIAKFLRIYIPRAKAFTYLHGIHRDPILGSSDMEVCYRAWQTKTKLRFLWSAFLENQVTPKAIVHAAGDDQQGASDAAAKVATLKGGGVVGISGEYTVTPWESNATAAQAFTNAINYLDEEMYASVLANFLGLGTASGIRGGGSFALSLSQTDFYLQSRQAVLDELAEQITHQLIGPMIRWNFGANAVCPRFEFVGMAPTSNTTEAIMQMVTALVAVPPAPGAVSAVPAEFIDELVDQTAGMLGLDTVKVKAAVETRRQQVEYQVESRTGTAHTSAAPVHAAVDVLAGAVASNGASNGASTNGAAPAAGA